MKANKREDFIKRSKEKHGNLNYDYSHVIFINGKTPVILECPLHGQFSIQPQHHLQKSICPECAKISRKLAMDKYNKTKRDSLGEVIQDFSNVHGNKYDYSKVVYTTAREKVIIICKEHGEFEQLSHHHKAGRGCPKCGNAIINVNNGKQYSQEQFISKVLAKNIEGVSLDKTKYISKRKEVIVTCNAHGDYITKAEMLLKGHGCPRCNNSVGESIIKKILISKGINYEEQKGFSNLRFKRVLKFDFYLPSYNACIEFDGEQHFKNVEYWGGEIKYQERLTKDSLKNNYCKLNNIPLLRIRYDDKNIETTIKNFLDSIKINTIFV